MICVSGVGMYDSGEVLVRFMSTLWCDSVRKGTVFWFVLTSFLGGL